jgi:hypothetical protein
MIITTTGEFPITPITAATSSGVYYQVRIAEITEIDISNHKIYCLDLGWIDWDLPVASDKRRVKQ